MNTIKPIHFLYAFLILWTATISWNVLSRRNYYNGYQRGYEAGKAAEKNHLTCTTSTVKDIHGTLLEVEGCKVLSGNKEEK